MTRQVALFVWLGVLGIILAGLSGAAASLGRRRWAFGAFVAALGCAVVAGLFATEVWG